MSRVFAFIPAFLLILPVFAQEVFSSEQLVKEGYKRYGVESCIVHYLFTGAFEGKAVMYADRWGWREGNHNDKVMGAMGMTIADTSATFLEGEIMTTVDFTSKTGIQTRNPMLQGITSRKEKEISVIGEEMMRAMGGVHQGTKEFMGKTCDVWYVQSAETTTWIWKGIVLKTEVKLTGMEFTQAATKIEVDIPIPVEKLLIPESIAISKSKYSLPGDRQ